MTTELTTKIDEVEFTADQLNAIPVLIDQGSIVASLTVLAALAQAIDEADVDPTLDLEAFIFNEDIASAINNVVSWFADEHGDPIQGALSEIENASDDD